MPQPAFDLDALQEMALFGAIDGEVLRVWLADCAILEVDAGKAIYTPSSCSREMYLLLDGEARIRVAGPDGTPHAVATVRPGGWFGETGPLTMAAQHDEAIATQACRLMEISTTDLRRLYRADLKSYALLAMNLARESARRLRRADRLLAAHLEGDVDRNAD